MTLDTCLACLTPEIEDPEEEVFVLFSQDIPSQNLGFVDPQATVLDLTIGNRDLQIHQSPTVLASTREKGTTGAVVWKITPLFAEWISSTNNFLFTHQVLNGSSTILELGCGISGITALTLAPLVKAYTLTDQEYVMKLLNQNLEENQAGSSSTNARAKSKARSTGRAKNRLSNAVSAEISSNVAARTLDWEADVVNSSLGGPWSDSFDVVIACDCIYNEALIDPLVRTCEDVCKLRGAGQENPTLCIVAQQLRSAEVFEAWLKCFHATFRVWQVTDALLTPELRTGSGFVIHVGILRET